MLFNYGVGSLFLFNIDYQKVKAGKVTGDRSGPSEYKINISMALRQLSHHRKQLCFPILNPTFQLCTSQCTRLMFKPQ